MKTLLGIGAFCLLLSTAQAQTSGGRSISLKPQAGKQDFLLELGGINGESGPDSVPPRPKSGFFVGAGAVVAHANNNGGKATLNPTQPGFTVNAGYAISLGKRKLVLGAAFSETKVFATAKQMDVHGISATETAKRRYIAVPVQYQHYLGKQRRWFVGGGAYAGLLLPAVQKIASGEKPAHSTDAGLCFSAGARIANGWLLQANYQFALWPHHTSVSNTITNSMAAITLQFAIGPIIKIKPKGGAQGPGPRAAAKLYPRKQGSEN
jgi:hypothetical protein